MLKIKRLYTFMLQTFLPLFVMTFGICLFIVLMQFLWKYIDDMVGKGLEISVLGEMFFYAALSLVPMALPLAVLLASLMTFGNLGERLELLSMKAAGVSLYRIMYPLVVTIALVSIGAFFFQNNVMPVVQVKFYGLLQSIRLKNPELDIPERVFYNEIKGYSVYVKDKENQTGLLKDMMIYDYSQGFNNARVIVADSGRLKPSIDKLFLVLSLFDGESFENINSQGNASRIKEAVPYRREAFKTKDILIEFDANFNRADEGHLQNQYIGKNLADLQQSIDSMTVKLDSIKAVNSATIYETSYRRTLPKQVVKNDTITQVQGKNKKSKEVVEPTIVMNYDSIFNAKSPNDKMAVLNRTKTTVDNTRSEYLFKSMTVGDEAQKLRRHITEWHKKFTVSSACLVFFFIGAPLGAIIRKGGLGMPVVISVFLFIFYYIVDNFGFKMARDGVWPAWQGMWLSTFVLAPLGVFLTYKAVNDSVILNADTYLNFFKKVIGKKEARKIDKKDIIMVHPDYNSMLNKLTDLANDTKAYLATHRRWLNYLSFWRQGAKDVSAESISDKLEDIVLELSNSDQNLILNKLMDYPVIGATGEEKGKKITLTPKAGLALGWFFPIGIPVYLVATYRRKLLREDIRQIQLVSLELYKMILGFESSKREEDNKE